MCVFFVHKENVSKALYGLYVWIYLDFDFDFVFAIVWLVVGLSICIAL